MYSYTAYSLIIHSPLPLPELLAAEGDPDVIVRLEKVNGSPPATSVEGNSWWATAEETCFFSEQVGTVMVRDGGEIVVDPVPDVKEHVLRHFILGRAMAVLLHQRGLLVLHASAVELHGVAVIFLGGAGWGKSTVAASLHACGHGVVADDVVALDVSGTSCAMVLSAFPLLKLWPEVVASLGGVPERLPRLHPQLEKRARHVVRGFLQTPLPLGRVYVLAEGTRHEIEHLQPYEAFMELVRHSYAVRLLEATGTAASHFRQCVRLTNCVPIYRLKRQRSLASLPDLARLVEQHLS